MSKTDLIAEELIKCEKAAKEIPKEQEKERLKQFSALLAPMWLDLSNEVREPQPLIKQNDINICTLGNFSCIVGRAKSRKTFLTSAIVGGFLHTEGYMDFFGAFDDGRVLYIDTEQSVPHVTKVIRRIHRIAEIDQNVNHDNLKVLCLREYTPKERKEAVYAAMELIKPSLCIIDGVADLMDDTNSNMEAVSISTMLLQLTTQFNCHIITVLHTNPGSDKARGHIGSEIIRKAETVLSIEKDGETSLVKAAYCRDMDIDDFAFFINADGLPVLTEIQNKQPKTLRLKELFSTILPLPVMMDYQAILNKIVEATGTKERQARNKLKTALEQNIIEKNNAGYYHLKQGINVQESLPF